jgi:hypothetical protein
MRHSLPMVLVVVSVCVASCAMGAPKPAGLAPGTPYVSWIIMSGDGDNPDQEFVCQSNPRNDCVVPASRPDARVFSDVHFYYHGTGAETKYTGSIDIGFFQGSPAAHTTQTNVTVPKNESIMNQSVTGIVTSTPGTHTVTFALVGTVTGSAANQPFREQVQVVVK